MAEKIKIDALVLRDYISQYKATFNEHRLGAGNEIYKWKAVKCFQDNWNIGAADFSAMLKSALAKTFSLLSSAQFLPKKMLEIFADAEPETMRGLFRALFDEDVSIVKRVKAFEDGTAKLLEAYPTRKMTYQTPNSISTYLWLRYPQKYYAYKYSVIKDNAQKLCGEDLPAGKFDRMVFGFGLYDAICEELAKDTDLVAMSKNSLTDDCYSDDALKTLTIDVAYFISKHEAAEVQDEAPAKVPTEVKNIILYGAPGTGKTYSSVLYAVSIIEQKPLKAIKAEDYATVLNRYFKHKDDGLVAFTTFHQSFGYEEFIEGIRPVIATEDNSDEGKNIEYEVRDGVFKAFCSSATLGKISTNDEIFEKAWGELINAAQKNGKQYTFKRRTGTQLVAAVFSDTKFRVNWQSDQGSYNDLTKESIRKQWLSDSNRDSLSGGNRWLFDARQAVINEMEKNFALSYETESITKNRVFIIDEINRGNISKIFGELITLIEPTKRIGASEESRALLPYSGQNFGVPNNVYILGTMNTADRSIAMIDIALRRRFNFVEMKPDSGLFGDVNVEGIDIAEMLDTINSRITVLFDREHTIGHSYLLPLKTDPSVEKLAEIFENKIMPLLQEYFYDDYEKIQLVLGDNQKSDDSIRFVVKRSDAVKLFGNADIEYPEIYEVNREAFKKIEAYKFLS